MHIKSWVSPSDFYAVFVVIVLDFFAVLFHRCLSLKNLKPKNTLSYIICCSEAMKEATAVAAALAEVIVPQAGVTGMDSEIAATSVAVSATVGVAVAAVESVAVALAVNCNDGVVLGGNTTAGLISDERG